MAFLRRPTRRSFVAAELPGASAAHLGGQVLTLADAIAQSLAVGPIFCASLIGILVAAAAGFVAPLSMVMALLGMIAVGWVVSLFARRYAGAGSIYLFIQQATNPTFGLFAAGVYFIAALFLGGPTLCVLVGLNGAALLATLGIGVPWWVVAVVVALGVAVVNYLGVRLTTRTQLTLTFLSALPLLITAAAIAVSGGDAGHSAEAFNPAGTSPVGLLYGMFFAVALFSGVESAASLGEEAINPRQAIPRAVAGSILITGLFYVIITYTSAIGFGVDHSDAWVADPLPLQTLAARYVGSAMPVWIDVAILLDLIAMSLAFLALTSRGFFALARDGLLPRLFGSVSRRYATPVGGNMVTSLITFAAIAAVALSGTDPIVALYIGAGAGGLLLQFTYILLALVAIRFVRQGPWWRWLVLLIALLTPAAGIFGAIASAAGPTMLGIYGAAAGMALAIAWTLIVVIWRPGRLASHAAVEGIQ